MGGVVTVTDATFGREVIDSPLPVVVNFTAEWCAPCRITEPILKELSHKLEGRVKFAKVDVDEAGAVTRTYGIHSILKRYFDFVEPRPSRVSAGRPASP